MKRGCTEVLDPIMEAHGFRLQPIEEGKSSGGRFARACYLRGDWRLELHFRNSLGLVSYHLGVTSLDHPSYMWLVLGGESGNQYPGFSSHPLDGFRHLAHDLKQHAGEFLRGDATAFTRLVRLAKDNPKPGGFKAIQQGHSQRDKDDS